MESRRQRRPRKVISIWHRAAVVGVLAVGVLTAVTLSLLSDERYRASASYVAVRTRGDVSRAVAAQKLAVARTRAPGTADDVELNVEPSTRVVEVRAVAPTAARATKLANLYAAELMGRDRGINRLRLATQIRRLEARISKRRPGSRARRRLERQLERLERRQITNAAFRSAATATRLSGPDPARDAAFAVPVSALLAVAVALALERARRRDDSPTPAS